MDSVWLEVSKMGKTKILGVCPLGLPITRVLRWPGIRPGIKNSGSGTRVTRVAKMLHNITGLKKNCRLSLQFFPVWTLPYISLFKSL